MWRAVTANDLFYYFAGLINGKTSWNVKGAPEYLIVCSDRELDVGCNSFTLDIYNDRFGSPREI